MIGILIFGVVLFFNLIWLNTQGGLKRYLNLYKFKEYGWLTPVIIVYNLFGLLGLIYFIYSFY